LAPPRGQMLTAAWTNPAASVFGAQAGDPALSNGYKDKLGIPSTSRNIDAGAAAVRKRTTVRCTPTVGAPTARDVDASVDEN
jgi:hypothetical protein